MDVLMSVPDRFLIYFVQRHSRVYERTWKRKNEANKWVQDRFAFNYIYVIMFIKPSNRRKLTVHGKNLKLKTI